MYIVYELGASGSNNSDPTLKNCLFGAVTLTKNADIEKYGYSGILDLIENQASHFLVVDLVKIYFDNKEKNILVLGKRQTQGLEHTLAAEKMCSISFTVTKKKFCLSLHYNGANSYLFVNGKEILKFKAKDSEIVATPLYLGNISKDWSVDNMKKTEFNGYDFEFSVDCYAVAADDIKDIHKYWWRKII